MGLTLTLILTGALAAVALVCGWLGARPPDPRRGPRLFPYRFAMTLSVAGLLYLTVHLLSLVGLKTTGP